MLEKKMNQLKAFSTPVNFGHKRIFLIIFDSSTKSNSISLYFGQMISFSSLFQERDWALSASTEARVLCETIHEGHPHRPANDLYAPHRLHG